MGGVLAYLREINAVSVFVRLTLAMFFGGIIGIERERKGRPAGFRTYMLVCLGAALTMLLSQYEYMMLKTVWAAQSAKVGIATDVSRFGAQVINGIGFLGAGTVLVTGHQEIKGLTTAAGLWVSAIVGLSVGAGFYEVIIAVLMVVLCFRVLPQIEGYIIERARNMNIYVEFSAPEDLTEVLICVKEQGARIYEVDANPGTSEKRMLPNAVLYIQLGPGMHHTQMFSALSSLKSVVTVDEI